MREVPVRLRIIGSDPRVLPSLTVSADVLLDRMENVLLVSRAAVFSQSPDGSPFALLRSGDGWERRSLQVGLTNHTAVAVLSGLTHGDIVAAETPEGFSN